MVSLEISISDLSKYILYQIKKYIFFYLYKWNFMWKKLPCRDVRLWSFSTSLTKPNNERPRIEYLSVPLNPSVPYCRDVQWWGFSGDHEIAVLETGVSLGWLYVRNFLLVRASQTPNSYIGNSRLIISAPFSYFILIFYLPRCTLPDFSSVSSLASLPFLSRHQNKIMYLNSSLRVTETFCNLSADFRLGIAYNIEQKEHTEFSFCSFLGFLAIFILLKSQQQSSVSSLTSLPFLSCCHHNKPEAAGAR